MTQGQAATFTVTAFNEPARRVLSGVTREGPPLAPGQFQPAAESDPIPGIDVKIGKNPGGMLYLQTTSGGDGSFTFNGIRAGNYLLTTTTTGTVPACVTLAASDPASVQITGTGLLCNPVPIVALAEANPPAYQWHRDGQPVPGATNDTLTLASAQPGDSGATFHLVITGPGGDVTSQTVGLNVVPDTFPPTLISATANCASNKVTVTFSEPVEPFSAAESFNYTISGGVNVQSAMLAADGQTVCLFTDPLSSGVTYTLTVDNVQDLYGNLIASGTQINFACPQPVRLFINEWLTENVNGIVDPMDGQHDWFEIYNPDTNAVNLAGLQITSGGSNGVTFTAPSGYNVPAGGYLLVWADNQPEQNSTNSPDLHVNFKLCDGIGDVCDGDDEIGLYAADGTVIDAISYGPQTADVSEGRFPDGGTNRYLMNPTPLAANVATPVITAQPQSLTVTQGQTATFMVMATGAGPLGYSWRFIDIEVLAASPILVLGNVQPAQAGGYACIVSNGSGSVTSQVAVLTVVPRLPFAGLTHQGLGGARLQPGVIIQWLTVGNIGSSGNDGVSIELGKGDGWLGRFDPPVDPSGTGVVFRSVAKGRKDGMDGQTVGEVAISGTGDGFSAEFTFPGVAGAKGVELYGTNGALILRAPLPADNTLTVGGSGVNSIQWLAGPGTVGLPSALAIKENGIKAMLGLGDGAFVGGLTVPALPGVAAILVGVDATNAAPDYLSEVELRAGGLPNFMISEEWLGKFGLLNQAKGEATLRGEIYEGTNALRVANIGSSGEDGVSIQSAPASGVRVDFETTLTLPATSNTTFNVSSIVDPEDGQHDDWFAGIGFGYNGSAWNLTGASNGVPHSLRIVEFWDIDNSRLAAVSNPVSVVVSDLPGTYWPSVTWLVDEAICHRFLFAAPVTVEIDGVPYTTDELRVLDETGEKTAVKAVDVKGKGIEEVKVTGAQTTFGPAIKSQPKGGTICAGTPFSFYVGASQQTSPLTPITYQWFKDGTAINGATADTYVLPNPQPSDAGVYTATATDGYGTAASYPVMLTVNACGTIRGKVWNELNFDCVQTSGETPLQGWGVKLTGGASGGLSTVTDSQGNYSFNVPAGAYTVHAVPPNPSWVRICPVPPSYSVTLAAGQTISRLFSYRAASAANCPDLWVDVTPVYPGPKLHHIRGPSTPCCGRTFIYYIRYGNNGGVASSPATIFFQYSSPLLTIVNIASTCPETHFPAGSGIEVFSLPSLAPYSSCRIAVTVYLDCDITTLCANQPPIYAQATISQFPPIPECNNHTSDNTSFHTVTPCCSSDPNDCTVTPKGCGPEGLIQRDQTLTYLVQFQNEGGAPATTVVVQDVLDADLDMSTLEVLGASHDYYLETNGRELLWVFPDIGLAPMLLDEPASHGFVKFRIRPRADAPVGTAITNSAAIYFDINDPVVTATTLNTITEDPVPRASFTAAPQGGPGGSVFDFTYTGGTAGAQFLWNFGPNAIPSTSTAANPTGVMFTTPGPHLVGLDVRLGDCAAEPAVQSVTVTLPPVAVGNGAATTLNRPVSIALGKLLANDTDPDGHPLTIQAVSAASANGGTVTLGATSITYTPAAGFTGTDQFTYTISDGYGGIASASVEVLVVDGNLPTLNQVSLEVLANGSVRVRFAGIPGYAYRIQRATTLPGPWTDLATQTTPAHGIIEYVDAAPPVGAAFYRTASGP